MPTGNASSSSNLPIATLSGPKQRSGIALKEFRAQATSDAELPPQLLDIARLTKCAEANAWYEKAMSLTISIPDDFAAVLGATEEERERRGRKAIALELYREGRISLRRMGELAGLGEDYWAADRLRSQYCVPVNYSLDDLDADRTAPSRLKGG